jgi:4-amino-4-deoxy-L-arabinose transferase-like glycosyltransferase
MKRFVQPIGIAICVIVACALWLWGINDPYVGSYNANNNYLSLASKNYSRFGFVALKTLPTYVTKMALPQNHEYYLHHPLLFFWIVYATVLVFGSANWVVHLASFIFAMLSVVAIYFIGKEIWNRRVAKLASFLALYFPMSSFFWKFAFNEQITLFLNLVVTYAFVKFIKTNKSIWIVTVWIAAFLCILCDWYGGYLVFPFAMMLFTRFRKQTVRMFPFYLSAVGIGVLFFFGVLVGTGHVGDMVQAVTTRSIQSELLGLSFWWLRLPVVIFLRFIIYFTPLSIVGTIMWLKSYGKGKNDLPQIMVVFFAILGLLNVVVLPTASWGHGYFVYYCIPFFAYTGALFLASLKRSAWRYGIVLFVIVWSVAVNFSKVGQVRKQSWKFDVSTYVISIVSPYETIGVINYPGDVLQNYYFIDAVPLLGKDGNDWIEGRKFDTIRLVIFTCENMCNENENDFIRIASEKVNVEKYTVGINSAWILRKDRATQMPEPVASGSGTMAVSAEPNNPSLKTRSFEFILGWYRKVKRVIGEVQL